MIRLLQLIFLGHIHKWKTVEKSAYEGRTQGRVTSKGTVFTLQCEHCGEMKTYKDMS